MALVNSLTVWLGLAIDAIERGEARDLSCGYRCTPIAQSGAFRGQRYDLVMTEIIGNHCSLVPSGRVNSAVIPY